MRKIKFRAWDTEEKCMRWNVPILTSQYLSIKPDGLETKDFPLMQSTGLKDKSGVEIYEGDIVKGYSVYPEPSIFEPFLTGEVYYTNRGTWDCYSYILGSFNEQVEVIGNIYENPELLEVEENEI